MSSDDQAEELSRDGAKGGKIDTKSIREAEVGIRAEQDGLLDGPLRTDPSGNAEFIDANGDLWDIKAFRSTTPDGRPIFDLERTLNAIQGEFLVGENILLDIADLNFDDFSALVDAIDDYNFDPELKVEFLLE